MVGDGCDGRSGAPGDRTLSGAFSTSWLDLREPVDAEARDRALLSRLAAWSRGRDCLRIVDLGAGTGANLRRTAPALGCRQSWTLVELDPALIANGAARLSAEPVDWRYRGIDLAKDLELLAEVPCDLITASAFLDLVSAEWLERLVAQRRRLDAALYLTLSFDGGIEWRPADHSDGLVAELVRRHQRSDKGFGPACGPDAPAELVRRLGPAAGEIVVGRSDWLLGVAAEALQAEMVRGHHSAAVEAEPTSAAELDDWAARRLSLLALGRSRLRIGHLDLLYLPV